MRSNPVACSWPLNPSSDTMSGTVATGRLPTAMPDPRMTAAGTTFPGSPRHHTLATSGARRGFTAIELLVVIGIMMLLMGMATPGVIKAMRRGTVNSAANDISQCWRQARQLAMTRTIPDAPDGAMPKHYGLVIVQKSGERSYAAVIYDNRDQGTIKAAGAETAVLRRDPTSASLSDQANPPIAKFAFNRNVMIAVADAPTDTATVKDTVVVVYAQYRTGWPIAASEVSANHGPVACPIPVGIAGDTARGIAPSPVCSALDLQTVDYADLPQHRGFGLALTLYPVGVVGTKEL